MTLSVALSIVSSFAVGSSHASSLWPEVPADELLTCRIDTHSVEESNSTCSTDDMSMSDPEQPEDMAALTEQLEALRDSASQAGGRYLFFRVLGEYIPTLIVLYWLIAVGLEPGTGEQISMSVLLGVGKTIFGNIGNGFQGWQALRNFQISRILRRPEAAKLFPDSSDEANRLFRIAMINALRFICNVSADTSTSVVLATGHPVVAAFGASANALGHSAAGFKNVIDVRSRDSLLEKILFGSCALSRIPFVYSSAAGSAAVLGGIPEEWQPDFDYGAIAARIGAITLFEFGAGGRLALWIKNNWGYGMVECNDRCQAAIGRGWGWLRSRLFGS